MRVLDASRVAAGRGAASFPLSQRVTRAVWMLAWLLLCRWTPPPLHAWRCLVLRLFGATIGKGVRVWSDTRIWYPPNLVVGDAVIIGRGVYCYNQGLVTIRDRAVISWEATLCSGTHDHADPHFQLFVLPIEIGRHAWIAAQAFVGPGVVVGEGAVLGARGVATRALAAWTVHAGNPAVELKARDRSRFQDG